MSDRAAPVLDLRDVHFAYPGQAPVLAGLNLRLASGQTLFLHGPSGCGKSTVLNLAAGVLLADAGSVQLCGQALERCSATGRDQLRANHIGVVFQQFNLLPYLDVMGNVLLPWDFSARRRHRLGSRKQASAEACRLLDAFELAPRQYATRPVRELSVGQQQRVAAARALLGAPDLLIADEPTSALDARTRDSFIAALLGEVRKARGAVLLVSHDAALAQHFDQQAALPHLSHPEAA